MTTQKERELIAEIMELAIDIGAGPYNVFVEYHGHVHGFDIRIAEKGSGDWVYYSDTVYLSGRIDIWTAKESITKLTEMLEQVKKHHPQYDADGVKL